MSRLARLRVAVVIAVGLAMAATSCSAKHDKALVTKPGPSEPASSSTTSTTTSAHTTWGGSSTTTAIAPTVVPGKAPVAIATGSGVNLTVPQGWTWQAYGSAGSGCAGPSHPDDRPCSGVEVRRGAALNTATAGGAYEPDAPYGWYTGSDKPPCLDGSGAATTDSQIISKQTKSVHGTSADFRAWRVRCANGSTTIVERWDVAAKGVLFTNFAGDVGDDVITRATFA